jgi:hypothetical protein
LKEISIVLRPLQIIVTNMPVVSGLNVSIFPDPNGDPDNCPLFLKEFFSDPTET